MANPRTPLLSPTGSVRQYSGEQASHAHEHAQILFAVAGRMALEVEGHSAFCDAACGMVIPAGTAHSFLAPVAARMLVIDAPMQAGTERVRRFAVRPEWRCVPSVLLGSPAPGWPADALLQAVLGSPRVLVRRQLDVGVLDAALDADLAADWTTARMAALFALSPQRFHVRLIELTGQSPMAYTRQRRLAAAVRLVRQGLLLETVALQVGYRSASALAFALQRDCDFSTRVYKRG